MLTKGVFLLHDNASVHKVCTAQVAIHTCGFETLTHPPYNPHLTPSLYHLFQILKSHLHCCLFEDDDEFTEATEALSDQRSGDSYETGIKSLIDIWSNCTEANGDYNEKWYKNCLYAFLSYVLFAKLFECSPPQYTWV